MLGYHATLNLKKSFFIEETVTLVVKNTGIKSWYKDVLRVGTARPYDQQSSFYERGWLTPNRIGTCLEAHIPPGEEATFVFKVTPRKNEVAHFQIVVDGVCWIANSGFTLDADAGVVRSDMQRFALSNLIHNLQALLF